MGRSYIVEEAVGQYLLNFNNQEKAFVSGLLIGQCSSQRDYVVLATRTPPREEQNEDTKSSQSQLDDLDEEWITAHANQVSRMLPGGLLVLGIFIITTPDLGKDVQNALRRLVFAVEKSVTKKRLWNLTEDDISDRVTLHVCSSTKKILCRTYDIRDPKSLPKPADWKYQNGLSTSWLSLDCTIHVNIHVPLSTTTASYPLEKNTKNGLARWAKQIEGGVYLINGQVKEEDCELLEGQKKSSRGNTQTTSQTFDVRVLTHLLLNSNHRSTATVQVCSGSVNLKGSVTCRAYIHSNKPKVKDAVQALKRDILNTVSDRCEILFEDLLMNETPGNTDSEKEFYALPHRVFAPIPGSSVKLCDYKFRDESTREIQEHFMELLDQHIGIDDLEIAEEINTGHRVQVACLSSLFQGAESNPGFPNSKELSLSPCHSAASINSCMKREDIPEDTYDDQPKHLVKTTVALRIQQNIGVAIAAAVALLAAGFSFHYFSD
ncbi:protein odr-4 homolog isoform X1 [Phascolarctos cinereus]|uniref:Protein odr-4 homolog n=1 Tax=Phascolarctos cinereus TaxID=38626 RepID=A0A6P5K4Z9_PHACI|nr:protein odr-4 homolog isoform X1 [Phascolarctos cinereus]XP_020840074.1 protein odr-4 homolog isoform X1 [Phascolarctos cinereus]